MMTLEQEYISTTPIEHRKKFAQFFTPEIIAEFMCRWVMLGKRKTHVLEPAYGLGIFSRVLTQMDRLSVDAYEIDPVIYSKALSVIPAAVNLQNKDYIESDWNSKYDAIVCNPPYLKFHDYDNASYIPAVNRHLDVKLNGFANLYSLFLLKSLSQLADGGRLAYIIPSEFLNSDYGVAVKRALINSNTLRHIIVIDFTECAFDEALTTSCILLCERGGCDHKVTFSVVKQLSQLNACLHESAEYEAAELDPEIKWKSYYEVSNGNKYNHLVPFSTFAKVSRGIATGANDYFTFRLSKIDQYNIPRGSFRRCICHAVDVKNLIFTEDDFDRVAQQGKTVFLFDGCADNQDLQVRQYISFGEEIGVNKKYLTACRNPWYSLEKRHPSPIWVSVFNRKGLRFVRNKAGAYNLTTFHCVYNISDFDTDILFVYLITDVAKEIFMDNSRQYGGGLVKFEPNDLNNGNVVDLRLLEKEERLFLKDVYDYMQTSVNDDSSAVMMLNDFFRDKYIKGSVNLRDYRERFGTSFTPDK